MTEHANATGRMRKMETREPVDVLEWVRDKLGFVADGKQAAVLRNRSGRGILNCTRQWGKSTTAAAKAVHQAYTVPGSLTLVVSPSARQSGELVRKAEGFVQRLGVRAKGDGHNELSLELPNGGRIVGLPGTEGTIRGFSAVSLLLIDEAALVSDDLYTAVRPMVAVSEGSIWLMSTPRGKRGFFYDVWTKGGPEWQRIQATAFECPRIPDEFVRKERETMVEQRFRQEYLCEFSDSVSGVFDRDAIERAITTEVEPLRLL